MTIKSLVGFTELSKSVEGLTKTVAFHGSTLSGIVSAVTKSLAALTTLTARIAKLEETIAKEHDRDREFIMSVITLLTTTRPNQVVKFAHNHRDPFEELPLDHPDGQSREELGVYQPEAEG